MQYKDAVNFNDKLFFSGSVELDWISNNKKLAQLAADNYVFHSQKSFSELKDHKKDPISFTKILFDHIYSEDNDNPFFTIIAGYGAGKSHYSTALAALIGNNKKFLEPKHVLKNIKELNDKLAVDITHKLSKPNLVFVFNGMDDFNLTFEMRKQLDEQLSFSNINIQLFKESNEFYENVKTFINNFFDSEQFQISLKKQSKQPEFKHIQNNKKYFIENVEKREVFRLVNIISEEITGNLYKIETFLNPKIILEKINDKLCGDGKIFDKVLIIFDEIGRYIEWLGKKREIDSSIMQQLYEGIKNNNKTTTFVSFIQFPLTTYFSNWPSTSYEHIARFVDRYKSSRVYHLSSLLESVFANLIEIKDDSKFINFSNLQEKILKWHPKSLNIEHWKDEKFYKKLICEKLKPFHPLTILLLSRLSEYTQKRGPIKILADLLDLVKYEELSSLPSIRPISIFDTEFVSDILKMEADGRIKSDYVYVYDKLTNNPKIKGKLGVQEKGILQALVICNLLELRPYSREDYRDLMINLTGFKNDIIEKITKKMEQEYGIINYDKELFIHHIESDVVTKNDFEIFLKRKINELDLEIDWDGEYLEKKLKTFLEKHLQKFKTKFFRNITTQEWEFPQFIFDLRSNIQKILFEIRKEVDIAINPNQSKGAMVWIYINCPIFPNYENNINEIIQYSTNVLELNNFPIQVGFFLDTSGELIKNIKIRDSLDLFTNIDKDKYSTFYENYIDKTNQIIADTFISLRKDALFIINGSTIKEPSGYKSVIDKLLIKLYPLSIPFKFDGFDKIKFYNAKNQFLQIIKGFSNNDISKSQLKVHLEKKVYNRMISLLEFSWEVFDGDKIGAPKNNKVKNIYNSLSRQFESVNEENNLYLEKTFSNLFKPPFGMNVFSASLILIYTLSFYRDRFLFIQENKEYSFKDWVLLITQDSNLNYPYIKTTTINYCDPKKLKESIDKLFDDILNSNSIDEILNKHSYLIDIINKFKDDKTLNKKINDITIKINNAKEINENWKTIKNKLLMMKDCLNDPKIQIPELLKISPEIIKDWGQLKELAKKRGLETPNGWFNLYNKVYDSLNLYITSNFNKWFENNNYPKNLNIGPFNEFLVKISKSLHELGFKEFGKKVKNTVEDVTNSFDFQSNCYNRISNYSNMLIPDKYEEINQFKIDISDFIKTIKKSNLLKKQQKIEMINGLKPVIDKIEEKVNNFKANLTDVYDDLSEKQFNNISELTTFQTKLKSIIREITSAHSDYQILSETIINVEEIINSINDLKNKKLNDTQIKNEIESFKERFTNNLADDPDYVNCGKLLQSVEKDLQAQLKMQINKWMSVIPNKLDKSLPNSKIDQLYEYVSSPPFFLNDKALKQVSEVKGKISSLKNNSVKIIIIHQFKSIKNLKLQKEIIDSLLKLIKD